VHGASERKKGCEKQTRPREAKPAQPFVRYLFGTARAIQKCLPGTSFDSEEEIDMATRIEQHRDRQERNDTSTRADDSVPTNTQKAPDQWVTGNESMTGAQASYLKTLSEEAGEEFDDGLTKAEASKKIDELQSETGRGIDH
jgi:hypothetical protein